MHNSPKNVEMVFEEGKNFYILLEQINPPMFYLLAYGNCRAVVKANKIDKKLRPEQTNTAQNSIFIRQVLIF